MKIGISEEIQRVASFPFVGIGTCLHFYVLATLSGTYFSPIFCGLHSRVWATNMPGAVCRKGGGWCNSAPGLQVYHFYPFTPLASRLGVVFYFLDVMPMFCPYPTTCEWDDFHKAGRHLCLRVKCPYQLTAKAMLEQEIRFLAQIRRPTAGQVLTLEKLRKQYKEAFEK